MKYKLYKNSSQDLRNVVKTVLQNRGIKDWYKYLHMTGVEIEPYENLDNIDEAATLFMKHIDISDPIYILVDSDPDGYCSASMMYLYIKHEFGEKYPVHYILHNKNKAHGLSANDFPIPEDMKLMVIPDAGTNDEKECKKLRDRGIDVIILDHHEAEKENHYAIIVNNQTSDRYTNKNLCGAGIVYRFLQCLDDLNWTDGADRYLDLCAFANISDVMDMRSFETRYLTDEGLKNVRNKGLAALIESQDYGMNGKVTIHNIQWNITTICNAIIRIGSYEERDLLFRAFIEQDEYFEYKKRATKDEPAKVIQESIYDRAARLCKNAKSRQDKAREKATQQIIEQIEESPFNDKVIVKDVSDILDPGLTGVVAIKIADHYNKPCILLKKHKDEKGNYVYGGSGRNVNHSPIENFKDVVNATGIATAQGHGSAFGIVNLPIDKTDELINKCNDILKNVEYDSTYTVDFIFDVNDVNMSTVIDLSCFDEIICQGIEEPMIAVENIDLLRKDFKVIGKNFDTVTFEYNDIEYIKFRCKQDDILLSCLNDCFCDDDEIRFAIVGKPTINEYKGVKKVQIVIEDVNILDTICDNAEVIWCSDNDWEIMDNSSEDVWE